MRLSQRLRALEAGLIDTSKSEAAAAFVGGLKDFIDSVFQADAYTCRMDHVARCCGLPGAGAMRGLLTAKLSEDAFLLAGKQAYGDEWPTKMAETMESALERVCEVHGDNGPMILAKVFPPVLTTSKLLFEELKQ